MIRTMWTARIQRCVHSKPPLQCNLELIKLKVNIIRPTEGMADNHDAAWRENIDNKHAPHVWQGKAEITAVQTGGFPTMHLAERSFWFKQERSKTIACTCGTVPFKILKIFKI